MTYTACTSYRHHSVSQLPFNKTKHSPSTTTTSFITSTSRQSPSDGRCTLHATTILQTGHDNGCQSRRKTHHYGLDENNNNRKDLLLPSFVFRDHGDAVDVDGLRRPTTCGWIVIPSFTIHLIIGTIFDVITVIKKNSKFQTDPVKNDPTPCFNNIQQQW
jgi:hypothetical protein